ncbi:MAG: hypothetical protein JXB46_09095 [Candidatus Eisenbacteria bacterium]|nr:hypothetical protein [Candidatus Eisenbacteria bacterium]
MTHERDERWAYVVLVALAAAYIVYRFLWPSGGRGFSVDLPLDLPRIRLAELGKSLPYVAAPLIAVISELYRRRRAQRIREEWETRVTTEGFVRDEEDVEIHIVRGGRGTFKADVRLTRSALYLFDHTGRRDPVRFALKSPIEGENAIVDAQLVSDMTGSRPRVRVFTSGMEFDFASAAADGWWADLRRSIGKSTRIETAEAGPDSEGTY